MADLFKEILPSILITKKDILEDEEDYKPYLINKSLSYHYDCLLQANEMNKYPFLPAKLQYHYLINSTRGYRRPFQGWQRKETIENLEAIKEYYNYSDRKAQEALKVLSDADVLEIKNKIKKGGLNK